MAINTSNNKVRIINTTVSGLSTNSKFSDIKSPALVVNTSEGGVFYADGNGGTSLTQLAALPNHTHSDYATQSWVGANYLSKSGGAITIDGIAGFSIYRNNGVYSAVHFYNTQDGNMTDVGYLGAAADGKPVYIDSGGGVYDLIHSNNIGAFNTGSATKLATARTIWGQSFDGTNDITGFPSFPQYININRNAATGAIMNSSLLGCEIEAYSSYLAFKSYSSDGGSIPYHLCLIKGGNVAIGGTTADEKLHVGGNVKANNFIGNLTGNVTGNATTATSATSLSSFDAASSTSTKRYVWMSYDDNSAKPAYTSKLTFQTSTNTLFVNDKAVSLEGHGTHITSDSQTWSGNKSFKNYIILSEQNSSSSPNSASQIVFGASGAKLTSNGTGNVIINPNSGSTGQIIFMPGSDPYIKINGTKVSVEGHTHSGYSTTDTKNTAGSSNNKTKIFVVGAASQSSTGVTTYSDVSVYITNGKLYASNFITSSDERIKTNIKEVKNSVDSLGLRFVEFDYKDSSNHSAGHIAQEVKEVLPEFVHEDTTDEAHMLSIDYTGLHSVQIHDLIDYIKRLEKRIIELENKL